MGTFAVVCGWVNAYVVTYGSIFTIQRVYTQNKQWWVGQRRDG